MKKFFLLLFAVISCIAASSQNLNDVTFEDPSTGETFDFYSSNSNQVVYHAQGSPVSRRGVFRIGSDNNKLGRAVGEVQKYITIEIYVGDRTVTLQGIISYARQTGKVNYIRLDNGSILKPW